MSLWLYFSKNLLLISQACLYEFRYFMCLCELVCCSLVFYSLVQEITLSKSLDMVKPILSLGN